MKAAKTDRKRYSGGKVSKGGKFTIDHDFALAMARKSVEVRRQKRQAAKG